MHRIIWNPYSGVVLVHLEWHIVDDGVFRPLYICSHALLKFLPIFIVLQQHCVDFIGRKVKPFVLLNVSEEQHYGGGRCECSFCSGSELQKVLHAHVKSILHCGAYN